jgi:hypothetical protein
MKPSLPTHSPLPEISHRPRKSISLQTKAPRPSLEWINPIFKQNIQLTSNHTIEDDFEPYAIINELKDINPDILDSTINSLDSSLLYVKSIIPSATSQHR